MSIEIRNLSFTYYGEKKPSLKNVNLSIQEGECVLLCGKSGCGKTTLARLCNGLIPNFFHGELEGSCTVFDYEINKNSIEDYVPFVGSVFQNPKTQYFNTNTTAEMAFPCENTGMDSKEIQSSIDAIVTKFHLENLMNRSIFQLSGGEKQKTAFATATILEPKLLVLDEPTSNLDANAIKELHDMIVQLKNDGVTIVLAEHRLAWAMDFIDTSYYLEDGILQKKYKGDEFKKLSKKELVQMGLRTIYLEPYVEQMKIKQNVVPSSTEKLLKISNLSIGYNKKPVFKIPAMEFHKKEIIGIMGHNGIGKSTLIKTLCGLLKPISGEILYRGQAVKNKILTKNSYLIMQDVNYQLFSDSVINETLMDSEDKNLCIHILNELGLEKFIDKHPMALSGGQKQRTVIACSLVSKKDIIYMDEPTSGLDGYHMRQVGKLIQQLKDNGKTVVIITHDEELVANFCDRIYRLED